MKLPKTIDIFGKTYSIESMNSDTLHGQCCHDELKIYLDDSLSGNDRIQTLCHECLHAILYRIGAAAEIEDGLEEVIVDSIATWFVETFHVKFRGNLARSQRSRSGGDE